MPDVERPEGSVMIIDPDIVVERVDGDLGGFLFSGEPYETTLEEALEWAAIGMWVEDEAALSYSLLVIEGGLDHPELEPGASVTFSPHDPVLGTLRIGLMGCAGPNGGPFFYDRFADRVVVRVERQNDQRRLEIDAEFWDGGDVSASVLF